MGVGFGEGVGELDDPQPISIKVIALQTKYDAIILNVVGFIVEGCTPKRTFKTNLYDADRMAIILRKVAGNVGPWGRVFTLERTANTCT